MKKALALANAFLNSCADCARELDQVQIPCACHGLRPTSDVQFAIDAGRMRFDSSDGNHQLLMGRSVPVLNGTS